MQPHNEKLKYLLDIESIIQELDKILIFLENDNKPYPALENFNQRFTYFEN
jgi:hypothetical protein